MANSGIYKSVEGHSARSWVVGEGHLEITESRQRELEKLGEQEDLVAADLEELEAARTRLNQAYLEVTRVEKQLESHLSLLRAYQGSLKYKLGIDTDILDG